MQFHPEVKHTERGTDLLRNFVFQICKAEPKWSGGAFITETVTSIRQKVGDDRVICALSGGVDSAVAAVLVGRAIGEKLTNVFVDTGLLRKNEFHDTLELLRDRMGLNVIGVDASERFLAKLKGVTDPEQKRKIIGREFIAVFVDEAKKLANAAAGKLKYLVQGTLYPDVIESVSVKGPSAVIKTHHNVGGLPADMPFSLIEPLRDLFKDEVRRIGAELGLPCGNVEEASISRTRACRSFAWRSNSGKISDAPRSRRDRDRRNSQSRIVRSHLASLRRSAPSAKRRYPGR